MRSYAFPDVSKIVTVLTGDSNLFETQSTFLKTVFVYISTLISACTVCNTLLHKHEDITVTASVFYYVLDP